MKKFKYCILLLFLVSTSYLSSQSYNSGITYNILKGGVWGNWSNSSYTGNDFRFQYDKTNYTLLNHNSDAHPSNYEYRIELIDNQPKKSKDGWYEYQGRIFCSSSDECYDSMLEYYKIKKECKASFEDGYEKYFVFQCTVRTNRKIYDLVKKGKGTINVFYNGVGRAWSF